MVLWCAIVGKMFVVCIFGKMAQDVGMVESIPSSLVGLSIPSLHVLNNV